MQYSLRGLKMMVSMDTPPSILFFFIFNCYLSFKGYFQNAFFHGRVKLPSLKRLENMCMVKNFMNEFFFMADTKSFFLAVEYMSLHKRITSCTFGVDRYNETSH